MNGTIPHTIAHAIEVFSDYNKKKNSNSVSADGRVASPIVDLLVIATHVETGQANSNQNGPFKYVRIWIQDTTSSCNSYNLSRVFVSCFGERRYSELIEQLQIRSGDVLRFNRVNIKSSNIDSCDTVSFTFDKYNPETGLEYYRFGNIFDDDFDHGQYGMTTRPRNPLLQGEEIPPSMKTSTQCIVRLVKWYRQRCYTLASTRTDRTVQHSFDQHASLASLPCQYRSLMEFQSCIGLIGHLTVRVLQVESFKTAPCRTKQRHPNYPAAISTVMFVTLIDDSPLPSKAHPATLVIDYERNGEQLYSTFHSILSRAYLTNRPVVLTNMTSIINHSQLGYRRNTGSPSILLSDSSDSILIPTYKSNITLIVTPIIQSKNGRDSSPLSTPIIPLVPTKKESNSQTMEILNIYSSILGMTVWTSESRNDSFSITKNLDNDSSIESLLSLIFQSRMNHDGDGNHSTVPMATIQLVMNDATNRIINAEANIDAIRRLFGSDVDDTFDVDRSRQSKRQKNALIRNNAIDSSHFKGGRHCRLIKLLIHSMLSEQVPLQWLIEKVSYNGISTKNETSYRVLNVWLREF